MAKIKAPKLAKKHYKGTGLQRSGELQTGGSQELFKPLLKTKFLKSKKPLF